MSKWAKCAIHVTLSSPVCSIEGNFLLDWNHYFLWMITCPSWWVTGWNHNLFPHNKNTFSNTCLHRRQCPIDDLSMQFSGLICINQQYQQAYGIYATGDTCVWTCLLKKCRHTWKGPTKSPIVIKLWMGSLLKPLSDLDLVFLFWCGLHLGSR